MRYMPQDREPAAQQRSPGPEADVTAGPAERAGRTPPARVSATPAAREAIWRLRAVHGGAVTFVQSAGAVPMCFPAGDYLVGEVDLLLGVLEGCPFYLDPTTYRSPDDAELVLDVAPGEPESPSLGPGGGLRFVIKAAA